MTPASSLPHQNQEAERCVLGSLLRDPRVIDDVVQIVRRDDFYQYGHQRIFEAAVAIHEANQPVSVISLGEELLRRGQVEDAGGVAYIHELWSATQTAANVEYYARIVREKAKRRNAVLVLGELLTEANGTSTPTDHLIEEIERRVFDLAERGITDDECLISEAVDAALDQFDLRSAPGQKAGSIPTGFAALDALLDGMHPGELIVVAARPSVGKTTMALALARHPAVELRRPVMFVSLEQSKTELSERLLCSMACINAQAYRLGKLSELELKRMLEARDRIHGAPLRISHDPAQRLLQIAARARRAKRRAQLDLLVIDYLQLIEPENRRDPRHEQVAQLSRGLKHLARHLQVPVIALAQLNRESEAALMAARACPICASLGRLKPMLTSSFCSIGPRARRSSPHRPVSWK